MFSHCWNFQEHKYFTSFSFCSFDPDERFKKKKVIFGLKKTKSRVWESGIERFGGGRARHSERSWDVLISVMWLISQGYSSQTAIHVTECPSNCSKHADTIYIYNQLLLDRLEINGFELRLDILLQIKLIKLNKNKSQTKTKGLFKVRMRFHTFEPIFRLFYSTKSAKVHWGYFLSMWIIYDQS